MTTISDHFNGSRYHNQKRQSTNYLKLYQWILTRSPTPWNYIEIEPKKVQKQRSDEKELRVMFINHSTCLIQLEGLNILTDPIWSERASPFSWIGPKRAYRPGVNFEDLPPIDIVLISHNHYDHMDLSTLKRLQQIHHPKFFTGLGNKEYLKKQGLMNVKEFDWWQFDVIHPHLTLHFVPAQHFSGRGLFDRNKTLWGGFVLQGQFHRVYFAGDSGYGDHFKDIYRKLGAPTFAILPIGAFEPQDILHEMHESPSEAVQAFKDLQTEKAMAIHFDTFQLTDEFLYEAVEVLQKTLQQYGLSSDDFWILNPGEERLVNIYEK